MAHTTRPGQHDELDRLEDWWEVHGPGQDALIRGLAALFSEHLPGDRTAAIEEWEARELARPLLRAAAPVDDAAVAWIGEHRPGMLPYLAEEVELTAAGRARAGRDTARLAEDPAALPENQRTDVLASTLAALCEDGDPLPDEVCEQLVSWLTTSTKDLYNEQDGGAWPPTTSYELVREAFAGDTALSRARDLWHAPLRELRGFTADQLLRLHRTASTRAREIQNEVLHHPDAGERFYRAVLEDESLPNPELLTHPTAVMDSAGLRRLLRGRAEGDSETLKSLATAASVRGDREEYRALIRELGRGEDGGRHVLGVLRAHPKSNFKPAWYLEPEDLGPALADAGPEVRQELMREAGSIRRGLGGRTRRRVDEFEEERRQQEREPDRPPRMGSR